eukprot:CAMPEP_0172588204 /NCGR_PEP_ID=MMETSP1068-20121228/7138_1 /TAXON_ID=35684 /ORGANISM="Pseudopedinella elastica, Strain CCMP716" /LENGTH=50 /DNA_ID=CAMNT_0013383463 /DNA_START=591 /DNA_END=739 /DNA_ORIENTATION=+
MNVLTFSHGALRDSNPRPAVLIKRVQVVVIHYLLGYDVKAQMVTNVPSNL